MNDFLNKNQMEQYRSEFLILMKGQWFPYFDQPTLEDAFQDACFIYINNCTRQNRRIYTGYEEKKFLFGTGRNRLLEKYRARKKNKITHLSAMGERHESTLFSVPFDDIEDCYALKARQALDSLPDEQKDLISAVDIHNLPYADIAEDFPQKQSGLPVKAHRVREIIRKLYYQLIEDCE